MITHIDWYVRNGQRKYPIDESCSAIGDDGTLLPEGFLVDASIWAPNQPYSIKYVYVSSASVTDNLVSLTLLGCTDHLGSALATFVPLGAVSLTKPVVPYKNYPVEPLLSGVMGWVVFGHIVDSSERISLSFSTPKQSLLAPKAASFYDVPPIYGAGVYGDDSTRLYGDVLVNAQSPIVSEVKTMDLAVNAGSFVTGVTYTIHTVGDTNFMAVGASANTVGVSFTATGSGSGTGLATTPKQMLVLSLEGTEAVLSGFSGTCGRRPETGNCVHTPITSVGGVEPDCNGNITVDFSPEIIVRNFINPDFPDKDPVNYYRGGICLDSLYSINDMCDKTPVLPDKNGNLPGVVPYTPPCDMDIPFNTSFSSTASFKDVQVLTGYAYAYSGTAYLAAGMLPNAEAVACVPSAPASGVRTHTVTFKNTPNNSMPGLFVCDYGTTRLLLTVDVGTLNAGILRHWSFCKYNKVTQKVTGTITSGLWQEGLSVPSLSIAVASTGTIKITVGELDPVIVNMSVSDPYFNPTGMAGIFVGGTYAGSADSSYPKDAVALDSYSIEDTEL